MAERSIIHIGGSPGSGKSRMARALVDRLHLSTSLRAEHISIGDRLRMISRQAIHSIYQEYIIDHLANPLRAHYPMDDEVVEVVAYEALSESNRRDTQVVFLDGYPRYASQVGAYFDLTEVSEWATPGALVAELDRETAMARVLKRNDKHPDRYVDDEEAEMRMKLHEVHYPEVRLQLGKYAGRFAVHAIDTSGPKQYTDNQAFMATMQLLDGSLPGAS